MTPTEKDKELSEKLRVMIRGYLRNYTDIARDSSVYANEVLSLITADRKRVALEARISELKMLELPENEIQMVFANPCNICGHDYPKLRKAQQDRLSALKAQQEEV